MSIKIDYQYPPTVGEAVGDFQSVAHGEGWVIRPPEGVVWVIEFLGFSGAVSIVYTDGTNSTIISNETEAGVIEKAEYRITHDNYIVMINSSGGPLIYSYSGYVVNQA